MHIRGEKRERGKEGKRKRGKEETKEVYSDMQIGTGVSIFISGERKRGREEERTKGRRGKKHIEANSDRQIGTGVSICISGKVVPIDVHTLCT